MRNTIVNKTVQKGKKVRNENKKTRNKEYIVDETLSLIILTIIIIINILRNQLCNKNQY